MATDLERFRDHARTMAALTEPVLDKVWDHDLGQGLPGWRTEVIHPVPTEPERGLWRQLADEIDAYLAPADDQPLLEIP